MISHKLNLQYDSGLITLELTGAQAARPHGKIRNQTKQFPNTCLIYSSRTIPKTRDYAGIARASAIWALGRIYHAGRHRHILAELSDRLNDTNPLDPESPAVRAISSIVIGELGRPSDANTVYIYCGPHATDRIGMSCRWAYTRLTGKPLALPIHIISPRAGDIMPIHPLR